MWTTAKSRTGLLPPAFGLAVLLAAPLPAKDFPVDETADLSDTLPGDGQCLTASGGCSLRAAIQEANAFSDLTTDSVSIPAGTYKLTILGVGEDAAFNGDLDITADLDVVGAGPGETIIDANGIDRVFEIHDGLVVHISGVTIRNGLATHSIAPAYLGGGINIRAAASVDLEQCEVLDSTAVLGGGLAADDFSITTIFECSFRGNRFVPGPGVEDGAAILNQGNMDLDRVEVSANRVSDTVRATVLSRSDASNAALTVRNSTISGNEGVGLSNLNSELDVVNTTIFGNGGDGLFTASATGNQAVSVKNSIIAGQILDCRIGGTPPLDLDFAGEHNLDSDGSCPLDGMAGDLPNTDPLLAPLLPAGGLTRAHVPLRSSPVIDAGDNTTCESQDQRGASRPLDGDAAATTDCDIGAIEVLPCVAPWVADETLSGMNITAANLFEACFTITAGEGFRVFGPVGLATFRARDAIILGGGFQVDVGGTFEAILYPTAGSGILLP